MKQNRRDFLGITGAGLAALAIGGAGSMLESASASTLHTTDRLDLSFVNKTQAFHTLVHDMLPPSKFRAIDNIDISVKRNRYWPGVSAFWLPVFDMGDNIDKCFYQAIDTSVLLDSRHQWYSNECRLGADSLYGRRTLHFIDHVFLKAKIRYPKIALTELHVGAEWRDWVKSCEFFRLNTRPLAFNSQQFIGYLEHLKVFDASKYVASTDAFLIARNLSNDAGGNIGILTVRPETRETGLAITNPRGIFKLKRILPEEHSGLIHIT